MAINLVYYNQEDPRWRNTPYTVRNDPTQTIGTSGCGITCFAMAASTFLGKEILPTEMAKYAVTHGFRTEDQGTAWGFFAAAAKSYGLLCQQTGSFSVAKSALSKEALVIASMHSGHFTSGGHYILLVGAGNGWIDVLDPNKDNHNYTKKYGNDGLIDQGVKDDGKVRAKEEVIQREGKQFWIIAPKFNPEEDDAPMTAEEKKAFDDLKARVVAMEERTPAPKWFVEEFGSADLGGLISDPQFTAEGWRTLAVALRALKKG